MFIDETTKKQPENNEVYPSIKQSILDCFKKEWYYLAGFGVIFLFAGSSFFIWRGSYTKGLKDGEQNLLKQLVFNNGSVVVNNEAVCKLTCQAVKK